MTLKEIAHLVNGKLFGNENTNIYGISSPQEPKKNTIVYIENKSYLSTVINSPASALLLSSDIDYNFINKNIVRVRDGKLAFIKILDYFKKKVDFDKEVHPTAIIDSNVSLGKNVTIMAYSTIMDNAIIDDDVIIYPHCFIGKGVHIKEKTTIHANVVIERECIIGKNNIIHSGAVIGSDGFAYYDTDNKRYKIPHLGIVELDDNVEIGSNTSIDRATIGKTFIGSGTKIDNLVQIAHNCSIGKNCYIAGQAGIAGSSHLGNDVTIAGQAGIVDHITIGDRVLVMAKSTVTKSIKSDELVLGFPAKPVREAKRILASLSRLSKTTSNYKCKNK